MKRVFIFTVLMTSMFSQLWATGLVTNTNQSAKFTRLQNRNASTGIDAVYYNPAGVSRLGDGLFFSLNNQIISQKKTVTNDFPYLNGKPKEYLGKVSAPLYPGIYAAYNTGNFSFSFGFNPIGGGGGAKYDIGLPSFEMPISAIPASLTDAKIPTSQYSADIVFEGTSTYFGYQLNAAYKITDQLSLGLGVRMVTAKNTYNGSIENIKINPNYTTFGTNYTGGMVSATDFFQDGNNTLQNGSALLTQLSQGAAKTSTDLNTAINAGLPAGTSVPDFMAGAGMTETEKTNFATMLGAAGYPDITVLNVGEVAAILEGAAPVFAATAQEYATTAQVMAANSAATKDTYADVEQTGRGFTPIISINYTPSEMFNFSLRYEFKTKLELTTKVFDNKSAGIFVDGAKSIADMPAMLAFGAEIKPVTSLLVAVTLNTFFDKNVDYSNGAGIDMIKRNYLEYGLGVEYNFGLLRASAGWLGTNTGVLPAYQNDQRFSSNSNSFGLGLGYRISPMLDLNVGGQYSINKDYPKTYTGYTETYGKKTFILGIGLDFYFGKK